MNQGERDEGDRPQELELDLIAFFRRSVEMSGEELNANA
jgi:hypothetical protein